MISEPGNYSWPEMLHAVQEGQTLYHELRSTETEMGCSLERDYFPSRLSQLETRMLDARARARGVSMEALYQEGLLEQISNEAEQLERLAMEAGTTVMDLLFRGAEAVAEGRIRKKPGPLKGSRQKSKSEGPWTPQLLKAEMNRLQVTFEKLGSMMTPPCGRPSVYKWIQNGIPADRQEQITKAMEICERERAQGEG
jgi:hypothetical protein